MYSEVFKIIEGKNPNRIHAGYKQYPEDWNKQYNMLLMDGVTCSQCKHIERCNKLFGQSRNATSCQFYPSKFR